MRNLQKIYFTLMFFFFQATMVFAQNAPEIAKDGGLASQDNKVLNFFLNLVSRDAIVNIVMAILTILVTHVLVKSISNKLEVLFEWMVFGEEGAGEELSWLILRSVKISIWVTWWSMAMWFVGLDLWFFMGWIWLGVWFALKEFIWNFVWGVLIILQWNYKVWQVIKVGPEVWTILKITSLTTIIELFDGVRYYIPNEKFLKDNVHNFHANERRRAEVIVWVDYQTDLVQAKKIISTILESIPGILKAPNPAIVIGDLADSSINIHVYFWLGSKDNIVALSSNVRETIKHAFEQAWISIPFPQLVISQREAIKIEK